MQAAIPTWDACWGQILPAEHGAYEETESPRNSLREQPF